MSQNEDVRASALGGFIKVVGDDKTVIDKDKLKYINYARATIVAGIGTYVFHSILLPAVGIDSVWAFAQVPVLWIFSYFVGGNMFEGMLTNDKVQNALKAATGEDRELVVE